MDKKEDAKYMKKKVTTGDIEADLDNLQIVVNFETEVTILSESGEPLRVEKKKSAKRYKISLLQFPTYLQDTLGKFE